MRLVLAVVLAAGLAAVLHAAAAEPLKFVVTLGPEQGNAPLDGRVLVMVSTAPEGEPRFQIGDGVESQQIFGVDVEAFGPGREAVVDASTLGFPLESLTSLGPGTYTVQAVLHKYETFRRSDGHTVKLPMDLGEGQQWNRAPGNL
jgi:hypothetical protein